MEQSIAEMSQEISGVTSQSTISDNTVSATEAAAIRAKVCEIMRQRLSYNPRGPLLSVGHSARSVMACRFAA